MELKRIDRLIAKAKTWDELYKDLSSNKQFTQKFKGDVFERVTQAYLLTIPEYKSTLSDVWLTDEVPRTVLKKLNLPSKDFGVDLIAKTNRGEYWTIQCKFRTSNSALNYKDLSTFINQSFLTAKNIKLAIVAHTSSRPIKNRKFLKELSEIGAGRWLELTDEEWNNIRKFCNRKPIKIVKRKPRPHQRKAIDKAKNHFLTKKNSRGKLIMPCATGKSLAAFWIAQALDSKKVIVAVPSLALIKQSLNDWTKEYMANGIVPEWLCVCSDESTGKVDSDEFNTDTYDLGIPTTTDKDEIEEFLRRRAKSPKIIFVTYQSSPRLAAAAKKSKTSFDLCILDEAHKTVGVRGKTFSTLLFDKQIKINKRIYMTATERVLREKNDEVASMDDKKIYGDYIYCMTFKDAINQDIICDYKIVTMLISNSEVDRLVDENFFLKTDLKILGERSAQYLAAGIALKKSFKKYKLKHAISFHSSISLAKQFQNQQNLLNDVKSLRPIVESLHISSRKSSGERNELIKEFIEIDRSLLTNARCLTEGIDVPAIDCVVFVDPKQSTTDIVQAAGRALRKYPTKELGYILLPIVVPDDIDFETFSETTPFEQITSIIASLSSQDERIVEEYRILEKGEKTSGTIVNIESSILLGKKIEIKEFANAIDTKIWDKVGYLNRKEFSEAREYSRSLNLKNVQEWREYTKREDFPPDMPHWPAKFYAKRGWQNWGDWLGTGNISTTKRKFKSFKDAREYTRSLGLKSQTEWFEYTKKDDFPIDIPVSPSTVYKEWISFGDWIGSDRIATQFRQYRSFKEAKDFVKKLDIKTEKEWIKFTKTSALPKDIPASPKAVYKEWKSMGDWLGTGTVAPQLKIYRSFVQARKYVRNLGLKNWNEWIDYSRKGLLPKDIPSTPYHVYKGKGWKDAGDWLGTGTIANRNREFLPFEEARNFIRKLNLTSFRQWSDYCKSRKPSNIPSHPERVYKEWKSMGDWLGTGTVAPQLKIYRSFVQARKYARSLNLSSGQSWKNLYRDKELPDDLPSNADYVYKDKGWKGWKDFLGK